MSSRRIVRVVMSQLRPFGLEHIHSVYFVEDGTTQVSGPHPRETIAGEIAKKWADYYVIGRQGHRAAVTAYPLNGQLFIRTTPDGYPDDNLLAIAVDPVENALNRYGA